MYAKNWYEDIKKYYADGRWTEEMVKNAVAKGKISQEQCDQILGGQQND